MATSRTSSIAYALLMGATVSISATAQTYNAGQDAARRAAEQAAQERARAAAADLQRDRQRQQREQADAERQRQQREQANVQWRQPSAPSASVPQSQGGSAGARSSGPAMEFTPADPYAAAKAAYERRDYATAFRYFLPLAERGNVSAQNYVAVMYLNGNGVTKDVAEYVRWSRKGAAQGEPSAQYNLGRAYKRGEGVPQDYVEAYKWYDLAARNPAQKNRAWVEQVRDELTSKMTPAQLADVRRIAGR
jgi:TPR repeat protein